MGVVAFVLTALLILAVWYQLEFAKALGLLAVPMTGVGAMSVATARRIAATAPHGPDLIRRLMRHRFWTQVIGMVAVFVTAMYGMYENLASLRTW